MNYYYEITENNEVFIYVENRQDAPGVPLIRQPRWPNGQPWNNRDEAVAWAELYIEHRSNPDSGKRPGVSPEEPVIYFEVEQQQ